MKKTLNGSQMTELRKLGYMKDDSLAGLIEFLYEDSGKGLEWPSLIRFVGDGKSIAYQGTPMLLDDLYEATLKVLQLYES